MAENKDFREEHISQDKFAFVQHGEKIFDKKFETKPIGYFKDAMIRFTKNRGNVVASIILGIILLLSIFVPILSPKNAEVLEERVSYLPPRIPLLEDIGIATGYKELVDQQVDYDTIGTIDVEGYEEIGYPATMDSQYVILDTLENYEQECVEKDELCLGGSNVLRVDPQFDKVAVDTKGIQFYSLDNPTITVVVTEMTGENSVLYIQMRDGFGPYKNVLEITEPGTYEVQPWGDDGEFISFQAFTMIRLEFNSDTNLNYVAIESVNVTDINNDVLYDISGYEFSQLAIATDTETVINNEGEEDEEEVEVPIYGGSWTRSKGVRIMSSFKYDAYAFAFGEKTEIAFSKTEYEEILLEYGDACTAVADPDNPRGWMFEGDTCPIVKVNYQTESVWVDDNDDGIRTEDEEYYSYNLVLNYARYKGYDDIPYYIFGTTAQGKDLFKMIWIGARTSLILGLIVSVINISIGIVFGAVSGYYGGAVDLIMQRFSEIMGRIPWLVTLSIFTALIGPGQTTLILVLIINGWIGIASITRTQFYRYKGREYVLASRTLGAKDGRLIFRHILPNGIGTIITASILSIPLVIFTESTLSYLGFGIGHGQSLNIFGLQLTGASIGVLLNDGRNKMRTDPYLTMWPAVVISILMITFNMFGNALRDAFNPALRGSE